MSRKTVAGDAVPVSVQTDPLECPFREFRDNELSSDAWGMSTAAFRALMAPSKPDSVPRPGTSTQSAKGGGSQSKSAGAQSKSTGAQSKSFTIQSQLWVDDQTQPLPRSARHYLHGWIRAEDLAMDRWDAEVTIYDEIDALNKMAIADVQLCHAQVLFRSSFCRRVLSACFALERLEHISVEHQWELFTCVFGPEGWRAKCHIYSPGVKAGGGVQHRPTLSKNGCYLVRLFYLGAWRCVWVNDQIPVDTSGAPLLPFSPLLTHPPAKPGSTRVPPAVTAGVIYLWPLLLTKALLKLAAPRMNFDEDPDCVEDEELPEFDILHALLGTVNIVYYSPETTDELWTRLSVEVPIFSWDAEEDTSTVKSRSTKKPTAKDLAGVVKRNTVTYAVIKDTRDAQPFILPGITPGHEMSLYVTMIRDVPIKKPLPEPEVALWKYYRWVDWAKNHGLYDAYDCPRTRYLKVNGLLKSSYAPHLLDVQSTESITKVFIEEHALSTQTQRGDDDGQKKRKSAKSQTPQSQGLTLQQKAELREWIQLDAFHTLLKYVQIVFFPSTYNFTSAGSSPPIRTNLKSTAAKMTDIVAPKYAPLYLQLDGPEENKLKMCLTTLHPRILSNSGCPIDDHIEPAHLVLEKFEWFKDTPIPIQRAFMRAKGYESFEITLDPGRHFFRIWTNYRINWHMMMISESSLLLSTRDVILGAATRECPWASKFLLNLGFNFSNWIKIGRTGQNTILADREFFSSYLPDLTWDKDVVGYDRHLLHWMFRQALQSHLSRVMNQTEWKATSHVLRKYFCDPDFGFPDKPRPTKLLREITDKEICDCLMPQVEEIECMEEQEPKDTVTVTGEVEQLDEEAKPLVSPQIMSRLLASPEPPVTSQICEMATDLLPCAVLKEEREKEIRKHEAATVLQAYWRGTWARTVLNANITFTPETTKLVQERAFGPLESLSKLMNEFFSMYPGARYAYSIGSALSGDYGLQQHTGMTVVTSKCKWIPHFQGVFYCHTPVRVHFDVQSTIAHSTVEVYNNDTGEHLPQVYNSHITFDFAPNVLGFTVMGHGTLAEASDTHHDAPWQLTIMSCLNDAFHVCDNEEICNQLPLPASSKLHLDEVFVPNRRNILGGIKIFVSKHEAVSFRAAASSPDLEMVATLRGLTHDGEVVELSTCSGKGEIYWPYIRLDSAPPKKPQSSKSLLARSSFLKSPKSSKAAPSHNKYKTSSSKLKLNTQESRMYSIEVTCPMGWPLTLDQWKRVNEVRNSYETLESPVPKKTTVIIKEKDKGKQGATKDKSDKSDKNVQVLRASQLPQPGDACVELECAVAVGGGAVANRDDERDQSFAMARRTWAFLDSGRNQTGALIRSKEFRAEFLVVPPPPAGQSTNTFGSGLSGSSEALEGLMIEMEPEESKAAVDIPRPSLVSETDMFEMSVELEEEVLYLSMPDLLRDKFIPLDFLPVCTKEKNEEECILVTPSMAEAAKNDRHARIDAALERMHELQIYNEDHVLGRQKTRAKLLEMLFVDASFTPDLLEMMQVKEDAVAEEVNLRTMSATKKKMESKKK